MKNNRNDAEQLSASELSDEELDGVSGGRRRQTTKGGKAQVTTSRLVFTTTAGAPQATDLVHQGTAQPTTNNLVFNTAGTGQAQLDKLVSTSTDDIKFEKA